MSNRQREAATTVLTTNSLLDDVLAETERQTASAPAFTPKPKGPTAEQKRIAELERELAARQREAMPQPAPIGRAIWVVGYSRIGRSTIDRGGQNYSVRSSSWHSALARN
jgi:hypothetical protein